MPPMVASAPGSTQNARPLLLSVLFSVRCVTPASTAASRSSTLIERMRVILEKSIVTPPLKALTCPSSEDPMPKGMIGARWRAATVMIALTSSVCVGKTTTSGAACSCHDSPCEWCSSCVGLVVARSPTSARRSATRASRAGAERTEGIERLYYSKLDIEGRTHADLRWQGPRARVPHRTREHHQDRGRDSRIEI